MAGTALMAVMVVSPKPRLSTESIAGRRPYQEDAVLSVTLGDGRVLVAVADGMGGHAAGEVASALALEALREAVEEGKGLEEAFRLANRRVHEKAKEPGKQGMGTTLVAAVLEDGRYQVANVGDSRAYRLDADGIERLTRDHSFVAEAVRRGKDEEAARASRWKDALTRSIGTAAEVEVDVFGPFDAASDSALALCSDGLYKTLTDEELHEIFVRSAGPKGAAQSLVSEAFERGSDDNITVAITEFGEVPRDRRAGTMPIDFQPPEPDGPGAEEAAGGPPAAEDGEGGGGGAWWKFWA